MTEARPVLREAWRDPQLTAAERVADLLSRMTTEEKAAQLAGFWAMPAEPGEPVAPKEDDIGEPAPTLDQIAKYGLGQLTRVFGTMPVDPSEGVRRLLELQTHVAKANRFGIPAIAHEECLTGLMTWKATVFPAPLGWGASFDPDLIEEMAGAIGESMRRVGVHHGLAPVLDVVRDYRWGRNEECIGEDPYLVATIGSRYVRGLERAGIVATLKHFAGYASSRGGRNMAPTAAGPREFADVILEPFVTALRTGGARSVMHSYTDIDGVPAAADERLLTDLLRDRLGFTGIVVADYFGVSFLQSLHRIAGSRGESAALALRAGVDVELPTVRCYGEPLLDLVRVGEVPEELLDRAAARVLTLKAELGLLDDDWEAKLESIAASEIDTLDPPEHRRLARRLAEESIVLLSNDGVLPLRAPRSIALTGPLADSWHAMLGCYAFPAHVGVQHPDLPVGVEIRVLAQALSAELPDAEVSVASGYPVEVPDDADIAASVEAARDADICVLALGDRSGLFGRGTSGEGCDTETLDLPGRQAELAKAVLNTGTPTVIVLFTGRPYALGGIADRAAAVIQAFYPGEEGASAVAGVLSGRVDPSGRLPVSVPRHPGGQPGTYLRSRLDDSSQWSSLNPTPLYSFGHGLTYTTFEYSDLSLDTESIPTDGSVRVAATVRNAGERAGTEVVQLYLSDPVATVVRPVRWLAGWARVRLEPGERARVEFTVHADRTSFTGLNLRRIVEPGLIDVEIGRSSTDLPLTGSFTLEGPTRTLGPDRTLTVPTEIKSLGA